MGALKEEDLPYYSYDDYALWEGNWELIHGVPYAMAPAPMIKHQAISNKIAWHLHELLQECKTCQALLPVDWKIDNQTIVEPDNLIICHEPQNEAYITQAPKVIFEILSKSTAHKDKNLKYSLYEKEGVDYYIIVDPIESIAKIYKLHEGRYIKVCDTHNECVDFELDECEFLFDFGKIW